MIILKSCSDLGSIYHFLHTLKNVPRVEKNENRLVLRMLCMWSSIRSTYQDKG